MTAMTETSSMTEAEASVPKENISISKEDLDAAAAKSALQDNIERKGKNAYYFAHAHKANGPQWDGKAEPKLLSRSVSSSDEIKPKTSAFDFTKSNITSYAFSDEGKTVKLYINMEEIGEKCTDEDISLQWTPQSFCLVVRNYKEEPQCLSFGRLTARISNATCKKKKDRLVLILTKETEGEWHTINDKGAPDHELV